MTTDTKAVARWAVLGVDPMINAPSGHYVLFTDHERVVGELQSEAKRAFSVYDESMVQRRAEIRNLTGALAENRAEVERLRKNAARFEWLCKSRRADWIQKIDAAMENGNV